MSAENLVSEIDECWGKAPATEQPSPPDAPSPAVTEPTRAAAILRGSARGLEINVHGRASTDDIAAAVTARLAEAPGFFRGSKVIIRVDDGPLAPGCLARLDDIASRFELLIVEVGALKPTATATVDEAVPQQQLAAGSASSPGLADGSVDAAPAPATELDVPALEAPAAEAPRPAPLAPVDVVDELDLAGGAETRLVIGPVRSGVILEHPGHLIIFGDVNPGAEIRAEGNIVVLGRLRGTAHAGIGRDVAFIFALRLEPQQLRLGRQVARASDSDTPGSHPEIAHVAGGTIIVERYQGRLPSSLVASI